MAKNVFETLVGAIVLVIAGSFLFFAYRATTNEPSDSYTLTAKFDRVDGLSTGSDVRVSGLKVGTVINQEIEPDTYLANITIAVDKNVLLPADSSAEIVSAGLLGSKYLALVPGAEETMLKDGERIRFTQAAVSIEQLIGKFVFGGADDKKDAKKDGAAQAAATSEAAPAAAGAPAEATKSEEEIFGK